MKSFNKRETALAVVAVICLLLVVVMANTIGNLQNKNRQAEILVEQERSLSHDKDVKSNTTDNYIDTVCFQYRELYKNYKGLITENPSINSSSYAHYALPGSAKGNIDQCYQPE